jgi:hypothetical protein
MKNRINWEAKNALERLVAMSIMNGEERTLTPEEVNQINEAISAATVAIQPALHMFQQAKDRYMEQRYGHLTKKGK